MKTITKELNLLDIEDIEKAVSSQLGRPVKISEIECTFVYCMPCNTNEPSGMYFNIEVDNRYLDSYDLFFDDNIELIPIDGKAPSLDEEKCLYPSDVFSFDTSAFKSFSFDIDSSD